MNRPLDAARADVGRYDDGSMIPRGDGLLVPRVRIVDNATGGRPRPMVTIAVGGESQTLPVVEGGECRMATAEELRASFDTERPSREEVVSRGGVAEHLGRGEALCFVVWDADRPVALCFQGCTGD